MMKGGEYMNLLKAIVKTILSVLEIILIISLIFGVIFGTVFIGQYPTVVSALGSIFIGTLLLILALMIGWAITMTTKENYEMYVKKSNKAENTYRVHYNVIYERNRVVTGKTKQQAINNLYNEIFEDGTCDDCNYKITNIKEII